MKKIFTTNKWKQALTHKIPMSGCIVEHQYVILYWFTIWQCAWTIFKNNLVVQKWLFIDVGNNISLLDLWIRTNNQPQQYIIKYMVKLNAICIVFIIITSFTKFLVMASITLYYFSISFYLQVLYCFQFNATWVLFTIIVFTTNFLVMASIAPYYFFVSLDSHALFCF